MCKRGVWFVSTFLTAAAFAATLDVGTSQRFARIEEALAKATPGDVIVVYPGEYKKTAL